MITTVLLVAVSIAFGVYVYKNPPTTATPTPDPNSICMNYADNKASELSRALIHEMAHGYRSNQLTLMNDKFTADGEDKEDAHSIWFDLETVKNFVYHIEINAKQNKVSSEKLGLRIYYSRYPETTTWDNQFKDLSHFLRTPREKYERLHTLVMLPTINVKDEKTGEEHNYDFNPKEISTYTTGLPTIIGDVPPAVRIPALGGLILEDANNSSNVGARSGNTTLAQNHGSLIPPKNNTGEKI